MAYTPVENLQELKKLVRDPKESPTDMIKAAQLMKRAKTPVAYLPRSLAQAATQAQLPVAPTSSSAPQARAVPQPRAVPQARAVPQPRVDPRYAPQPRAAPSPIPQPRVPTVVPPPISPEDEAILMAQAGGRASMPQQIENLSSRGRNGDTMLMHVNPEEFQGLSTLLGPTTTNPDTGLPEAFAWWLPLIGAAIGGITTKSWEGAALGGLAGLGGAGMMSLGGASTAAGGLGSTWGPFSGLLGGTGAAGATSGVANLGPYTGLVNPAAAGSAASSIPLGLTQTAATGQALSSVPHTMGMFGGVSPQAAIGQTALTNPLVPRLSSAPFTTVKGSYTPTNFLSPEKARALTAKNIATEGASEIPWWKKGIDLAKDNPLETASALYGLTSLLQPEYATSTPTLKEPDPVDLSAVDPKSIRRAKGITEEEIKKLMEERRKKDSDSSFLEDTGEFADISFATANTGGIVALQGGGYLPQQYGQPSHSGHPYGSGPLPGSLEWITSPTRLDRPRKRDSGPPPPEPFTFPEVSPFASGASNFNAQDALSRIAGPNFQQIGNTIPTNIPTPPSPLDPATLSAGQGALADLLNRASQSSFADVGGIQEALQQPSVIQNKRGGTVSLAFGGNPWQQAGKAGGSSSNPIDTQFQSRQAAFRPTSFGQPTSNLGTISTIGGSSGPKAGGNHPGVTNKRGTGETEDRFSPTPPSPPPPGPKPGWPPPDRSDPQYPRPPGPKPGWPDRERPTIWPAPTMGTDGPIWPIGWNPYTDGAPDRHPFAPDIQDPYPLPPGRRSDPIPLRPADDGFQPFLPNESNVGSTPIGRHPYGPGPLDGPLPGSKPGGPPAGIFKDREIPSRREPGEPDRESGGPQILPPPPSNPTPADHSWRPLQWNTGGLLSILSNKSQRDKFDPLAALSPLYALKEDKYPEYFMPLKMIQGLATGGGFATGGEFAGHLQGAGDGMSDQIPFRVVPQTPQDIPNAPNMAVLSTDEYVFPADAVSMLGNGSSDAGAKILDSAVKNVRRASIGTPKQIKQINGQQVLQGALTT